MSLLKSQPVPAESKEGDRVRIAISPDILYEPYQERTEDRNYYMRDDFLPTHRGDVVPREMRNALRSRKR